MIKSGVLKEYTSGVFATLYMVDIKKECLFPGAALGNSRMRLINGLWTRGSLQLLPV